MGVAVLESKFKLFINLSPDILPHGNGVVFLSGLPKPAISGPLSAHQVLGRYGRRRIVVGQQAVIRTSDLDAFLDHICEREVGRDVDHSDSYDFSMAVTVQPVDEYFKLVGEPFPVFRGQALRSSTCAQ